MAQYLPEEPLEPGTMLSNGAINATILTYKPPGISAPFIITIVNGDKTEATIHVTENSTGKYILKGDTRSLTILNDLCGQDIDKSSYLRFDHKPANLPKGFEMKEPDAGFTFPPPARIPAKKASPAFDKFNTMHEALQEAEREPPREDSGAAARPPNTIFLLVSMHGARLESMPLSKDLPINKTFAYAPGECPLLKVSTSKQMARIEKYRTQYIDDIATEYFKDLTPTDAKAMLAYSVAFDQHYQCDVFNNENVFSNGIFVLGSNFIDPTYLAPVEVGDKMNVEYPQFNPTLYDTESAMALQKINLINIPVLMELSRRVTGTGFALEHTSPDPYFKIVSDDTGIPHYFDSKLSHYLEYCQRLGAEIVVLLDETCRIRSFRSDVGPHEAAAAVALGLVKPAQSSDPSTMRDPHRKGDYGGRRTKRKRTRRKRSRRFHKKS
jgi:hypothetical protein